MSRYVHFASRLTGWNAIKSVSCGQSLLDMHRSSNLPFVQRAEQLQLNMTDAQYKEVNSRFRSRFRC